MTENVFEDWESPVKHKMRSAGTTFVAESVQVKGTLASEQKVRENRTRTTIKHLLESEAERNEELGEDNMIIEKQLKALIGLLVEKDEKIKLLQGQKPEKNVFFRFGAENIVSVVQKILERLIFKSFFESLKILEGFEIKEKNLKVLGILLFKKFPKKFEFLKKYFSMIIRNLKVLVTIGKKRIKKYLNYMCRKRTLKAERVKSIILAFLVNDEIIKNKFMARIKFGEWKKVIAEMSKNVIRFKRFYCIMLQRVFSGLKKRLFLNFYKRTLEIKNFEIKRAHKVYLNNFQNCSQKEISLFVLGFFIKNKKSSSMLHFFLRWKLILNQTNINLIKLHSAFSRPLLRIFQFFIKRTKRSLLCKALQKILTGFLKSCFTAFSRNSNQIIVNSLRLVIEENLNSSLLLKNSEELLNSQYSEQEQENSKLKKQIYQLSTEIKEIENSLEASDRQYKTLQQETNLHLQQLDSYTAQTATMTSKYAEEFQNLQVKIKKQEVYIETANSKLQQIIKKHEFLYKENSTIVSKNQTCQQSLKKLHESYSKLLEEIKPNSDSKSDLLHLSQTLALQEEEISSLKYKLKTESNELKNLKTQSNSKSNEVDQQILKIARIEEELEKSVKDINRLETGIQNEAENKDFRLQEVNSEIDTLKYHINKARDDIENLRIQIKETSAKMKYSVKLPDEIQNASKISEMNKAKLIGLRETVNLNSSVFSVTQKELVELRNAVRNKKEECEKKRMENSLVENKIALAELSLQESQKQSKFRQRSKEDLENYVRTLEMQITKLNEAILKQSMQESSIFNNENTALAQKVEKLERELEFFSEEAAQRRMEVAQVKPEIENYRIILAAMEEKIAENESKLRETEIERDKLRAEGKILKDRFLSLSNHNSKY